MMDSTTKALQTLTILMILIMAWTLKTSKTKMMCLILTIYSIITSVMMSLILKMTIIPFITTLTMAGGLMVLFLYFTASANTKEKPLTKMKSTSILPLIFPPMFLALFKTMPENSVSQLSELKDPASNLFSHQAAPMTLMMIALLGIMLMVIIHICSQAQSPIRKKKS